VQLQGLRRNPKTALQEHAIVVERQAQVEYRDLPANGRQSLVLDAFLQSITNLGLKQHLTGWRELSGLGMPISKPTICAGLGRQYSKLRPKTIGYRHQRSQQHVAMAAVDEPTGLTTSLVLQGFLAVFQKPP